MDTGIATSMTYTMKQYWAFDNGLQGFMHTFMVVVTLVIWSKNNLVNGGYGQYQGQNYPNGTRITQQVVRVLPLVGLSRYGAMA